VPLDRFAPYLFVFLWSTGFIGARFGLPHAEPLTFLLVRYAAVLALLAGLAALARAPWPPRERWPHIAVAGLLLHGVYLGGVFVAIKRGLPAGVTSLVVGLQPILTAVGAGMVLGERTTRRQWLGLALGFVGVTLVLSGKLTVQGALGAALVPAVLALGGITAGTLYQKRYCPVFDLRTGGVVQFLAAAAATLPVAAATESFHVEWNGRFLFALAWLVLVLSLGAISLLNVLIRHGSAVNVARLFFLVPPTTSLVAYGLFGETLRGTALVGMGVAMAGVYLARGAAR
jgi:drug/metabolite transporter (DMT)-like permease